MNEVGRRRVLDDASLPQAVRKLGIVTPRPDEVRIEATRVFDELPPEGHVALHRPQCKEREADIETDAFVHDQGCRVPPHLCPCGALAADPVRAPGRSLRRTSGAPYGAAWPDRKPGPGSACRRSTALLREEPESQCLRRFRHQRYAVWSRLAAVVPATEWRLKGVGTVVEFLRHVRRTVKPIGYDD